ncbi:MAG: hypothetical protein ACREFB_05935 [Stellaceae bacterium]
MHAPTTQVSMYLTRPLRTLAAVCRAIGRDDNGRACTTCPLHDMCERGDTDFADGARGSEEAAAHPSRTTH